MRFIPFGKETDQAYQTAPAACSGAVVNYRMTVPCLGPNCGWAADFARGHEQTQKSSRIFKWILDCLIMRHSQTGPKCTILSQKILKSDPCRSPKNSGSAPGLQKKISQRGRKVTKHGIARLTPWHHHQEDVTVTSQCHIVKTTYQCCLLSKQYWQRRQTVALLNPFNASWS